MYIYTQECIIFIMHSVYRDISGNSRFYIYTFLCVRVMYACAYIYMHMHCMYVSVLFAFTE